MATERPEGTIKVWYIPQVPMKAFEVEVTDIKTALFVQNTIIDFSNFEFENRVKPDYSDASGICEVQDGEWWDLDEEEIAERLGK